MSDSIILVDHAALAAADTSDLVEATVTADRQPLASVLADLLRPLGLTYRAVGGDVIQVLTTEAADERLDLEFYSIAAWLRASPQTGRGDRTGQGQDRGNGLERHGRAGRGLLRRPLRSLLVLHSQSAQAVIQDFGRERAIEARS